MREFVAGNPPKCRTSYQVLGVSQPTTFGIHNNNLANLRRGVIERVFAVEGPAGLTPPPSAVPGSYNCDELQEFRRLVVQAIGPQAPASYAEFLSAYKGDRRLAVYTAAVESLKFDPVKKLDAYTTAFVKCEKINFSSKADPAARLIQPRTPRYNVEVGRFLKKLEKKIFKAIEEVYGGPTVMKGYNANETACHMRHMWESFDDPVAIGLDASRFDQHTGEEALKWEHSVYTACFRKGEAARLATLLSWQIDNEGCARATDGRIKYQVRGCRMSGDMNTSLGNCLIMCGLVYKLAKSLSLRLRLANNGDDCVVIMERKHMKRFMRAVGTFFLIHGYTMKVENPVFVFEEIEFCQTKPVASGSGWIMCRNAMVAMAKDSCSVLPLEQGRMQQGWLTAIGTCGMSLAGGIPVFQEFYSAFIRAGGGITIGKHPALETGFARLAAGMHRRYSDISDDTRVSFWKAFGILPSMQLELESELRTWTHALGVVHRRENPCPDRSWLIDNLQ